MAVQTTLLFTVEACSIDLALLGLTLVARVEVRNLGADVVAVIDSVAAARPDVVLMCSVFAPARAIVREAKGRGVNARAWLGFSLFDDVGYASDDVLPRSFVMDGAPWVPVATGSPSSADSTCAQYTPAGVGCISPVELQARFTAAFGRPAAIEAATTFASLELLLQAIVAANSTDPTVVAPLLRGRYWDTAYGRVVIGAATGHNIGTVHVRQAQRGGVALIASSSTDAAPLVYPTPTWQRQECEATSRCANGGSCRDDGGCDCDPWHAGATCGVAFGVASLVVGCCLAVAAIIVLSTRLQQWRSLWQARDKRAAEQREDAARAAALRGAHCKTMGYCAHELSNPLHAMAALLEEVASGGMPSQRGVRHLRQVVVKMRHVVDDMFTSAAGDVALDTLRIVRSHVRLPELLRDVGHRLRQVHGVRMRALLTLGAARDCDGVVLVDSLRLYQLLVHTCALLGDGSTAAGGDGCVELAVTVRGSGEAAEVALVATRTLVAQDAHAESVVLVDSASDSHEEGAAAVDVEGPLAALAGAPPRSAARAAEPLELEPVAVAARSSEAEMVDVAAVPVQLLPAGVVPLSTGTTPTPHAATSTITASAGPLASQPSGITVASDAAAPSPRPQTAVSGARWRLTQALPARGHASAGPSGPVLSFATVLDAPTCGRIAEALGGSLQLRLGDSPPSFTLRLPAPLPTPAPPGTLADPLTDDSAESDDHPAQWRAGAAVRPAGTVFSTSLTLRSSASAAASAPPPPIDVAAAEPGKGGAAAAGTGLDLAPPLAMSEKVAAAADTPSPLRVSVPAALFYGSDEAGDAARGSSGRDVTAGGTSAAGRATIRSRDVVARAAIADASAAAGALEADSEDDSTTAAAVAAPSLTALPTGGGAAGATTPIPSRGSVLIIEDERVNAKLLARMVTHAGFTPSVLYDGADVPWLRGGRAGKAARAIDSSGAPFLAILLDIIMPRSNGVDVCRQLRAHGFTAPIIATTANASAADVARYRAAGFDDVLAKPFGRDDIAAKLARWAPTPAAAAAKEAGATAVTVLAAYPAPMVGGGGGAVGAVGHIAVAAAAVTASGDGGR